MRPLGHDWGLFCQDWGLGGLGFGAKFGSSDAKIEASGHLGTRLGAVEPQLEALGQGFGAQGPIVGALGLRYGALRPRFGALGSTLRALGPRVRALASGAMIGDSWAKIWATGSRLGL